MELERKSFTVAAKDLDEETGVATFIASVFNNVDHSKDRVLPGAFKDTLTRARPKFVADHQWSVTQRLGKVLEASETDEGLQVKVKFNLDKQVARDVYSDFKFAPEDQEFSFGYSVRDFAPNEHGGRDLKVLDLFEVSPVLIGDNDKTRLVDVKSADGVVVGNISWSPDYNTTSTNTNTTYFVTTTDGTSTVKWNLVPATEDKAAPKKPKRPRGYKEGDEEPETEATSEDHAEDPRLQELRDLLDKVEALLKT